MIHPSLRAFVPAVGAFTATLAFLTSSNGCATEGDSASPPRSSVSDAGTSNDAGREDATTSSDAGSQLDAADAGTGCNIPASEQPIDVTGSYDFPASERDSSCNLFLGPDTSTCEVTQDGCEVLAVCSTKEGPATFSGTMERSPGPAYAIVGTIKIQGIDFQYDITFSCSNDGGAECTTTDTVRVNVVGLATCKMNGTRNP